MNWSLLLNCSLRADKAVDAFQLIVVESQRSQVELELAVELEAAVELELVVELELAVELEVAVELELVVELFFES